MKKKQVMALVLAAVTALSMTACGSQGGNGSLSADNEAVSAGEEAEAPSDEVAAPEGYDETSAELYDAALGKFNTAYQEAKEVENVSEKWAKMAQSEAWLLESGVTLPTETRGGNYAISRVAPYTATTVMWGSDEYRRQQQIVTTEPIKSADYLEMREHWLNTEGESADDYNAYVKSFLADKGYELADEFRYPNYTSDPVTWDLLATSKQADTEPVINTYDGLMAYDNKNELQPALAESYEISDDGLTYTFHIRDGVKWVDSQGREVADVCADDFVAGMQHMLDAQGGLEFLVQGVIKNANQYISGEITDFAEVGVSAPDEHTLVYTLESPCTYFMTMLGYSIFAPMSRTYYESQGGKFGVEYDASSMTYGTDPDHIAYCGPFLITNWTAKNTIVFEANPTYYAADKMNIHKITWVFEDGSDPTKVYTDMKANTVSFSGLNTSSLELAKTDGMFDEYAYVSLTDSTTFQAFFNMNRNNFANANDQTKMASTQDEETAARTKQAMGNQNFRLAIAFAVDRGSYMAQAVGEDLKYTSIRNAITPGNFVTLEEDVTLDINGTETTFPAGTNYGEIVQAQLDADGCPIKAFDPETQTCDGYDGWYNPENAAAQLELAIAALADEGLEISEENPIQIDLPYPSNNQTYTNRANSVKQSVESALGGKVIVNLVAGASMEEWYYAGYMTDYGYEANYDLYDCSGWGPDYGDPSTYLDTMQPDYSGYMTKCLGIY